MERSTFFLHPKQYDIGLMVLAAASGAAALIYEIVWFQLMPLIIGSSAVSLGVLLATFMGGLCVGSFMLPQVVAKRHHPLRVYALIELGIGAAGILILFMLPYLGRMYAANAAQGAAGVLLRAALGAALLLPPTILMGATLPAIARLMESMSAGISGVGSFYAANIAGAVFGCLFAGFYLLRLYDTATATYVAAAINVAAAVAAVLLAKLMAYVPPSGQHVETTPANLPGAWAVYLAIAFSGLTALGAEVTWTRLLALLFGASVYTFSLILTVFLFGLGIGSGAGAYLVRQTRDPRIAFGKCQVVLLVSIGWAAYMIGSSLPRWPVYPPLAPSPWFNFQIDLVATAVAILPAAFCWGASFPFALAAAGRTDAGRATAAVYAANTLGAIIGALGFSSILIPWIGPLHAQQVLIGVAAAAGLLMLAPYFGPLSTRSAGHPARSPHAFARTLAAAVPVIAVLLIATMPDVPDKVIAYGRKWLISEQADILYRSHGRVSSVAVTEFGRTRSFHVSGKAEASTAPDDMRLQRMLGHLPALLHAKPRSVLVVGFGAGVTAGTFVLHPEIERIVICEIEPVIPANVGPFFREQNHDVLHDPRVSVVYDDARHYVLTTKETFDVITSDPIHPWVKGAGALYTKEYFELARARLNPGGVVTQWVPLYETTEAAVKSEIATFFEVFPNGAVWSNQVRGKGSDIVLSGHASTELMDIDELHQRVVHPEYDRVLAALREVKFSSVFDLLATYLTHQSDLAEWLSDAEINTDRNLRVQYLAGMGLNQEEDNTIYAALRRNRSSPSRLLSGSAERMEALRVAIEKQSPALRPAAHQY